MIRRPEALACEIKRELYDKHKDEIRMLFSRLISLNRHQRIDLKRKINEKGENIIEIWSPYPKLISEEINKILGK